MPPSVVTSLNLGSSASHTSWNKCPRYAPLRASLMRFQRRKASCPMSGPSTDRAKSGAVGRP